MFYTFKDSNYFLLLYVKIHHNSFPSLFPISLKYYFYFYFFFSSCIFSFFISSSPSSPYLFPNPWLPSTQPPKLQTCPPSLPFSLTHSHTLNFLSQQNHSDQNSSNNHHEVQKDCYNGDAVDLGPG
jgi:predicted membrane metal-binding protein